METFNLQAYVIYLPIAIIMTSIVARYLFKNSLVFMLDIFRGREKIAQSTNNLFKTGFYLLNLGMAFLITPSRDIYSAIDLFEKVSSKLGGFTLYLGFMLFFILYLLFRGKKKSKKPSLPSQQPEQFIPQGI